MYMRNNETSINCCYSKKFLDKHDKTKKPVCYRRKIKKIFRSKPALTDRVMWKRYPFLMPNLVLGLTQLLQGLCVGSPSGHGCTMVFSMAMCGDLFHMVQGTSALHMEHLLPSFCLGACRLFLSYFSLLSPWCCWTAFFSLLKLICPHRSRTSTTHEPFWSQMELSVI